MAKYIVIAPSSAHKELLKEYRKSNPFMEVKVMNREEVYCRFFSRYDLSHIACLMHEIGITYDFANEIVTYFPYLEGISDSESEKIKFLLDCYNLVINDPRVNKPNPPFRPMDIFRDAIIDVYDYSKDDYYLKYVFSKCGIKDVNYKSRVIEAQEYPLTHFHSADEEVLYVLNEICDILKKDPNALIYLNYENQDYSYILNKYAESFNLKINNLISKSFITSRIVVYFLAKYDELRNVHEAYLATEEKYPDQEDTTTLFNYLIQCEIPWVTYEEQKVIFNKYFSAKEIRQVIYQGGLEIINSSTHEDNPHIFFLGFTSNDYPKTIKESSYLSADEKALIDYPTALAINKTRTDDLLYFLGSTNNIHLSYSEFVNNVHYYPTTIVKVVEEEPHTIVTYYSQLFLDVSCCLAEDSYRDYLHDSSLRQTLKSYCGEFYTHLYHSFDYHYHLTSIYDESSPIYLSFTGAETYLDCSYHYFLDRVINIHDDKDTIAITIGSVAHNTFEAYYKDRDNFNFDEVYDKVIHNPEFNLNEHQLLWFNNHIKALIKAALDHYIEHDTLISSAHKVSIEPELEINQYEIEENSQVYVTGRLDKAVITDDEYLFIVDYKSSPREFKPDEITNGHSLQLATYAMLSSSVPTLSKYTLGGFFYAQFLPKKLDIEVINQKYLILIGKILDDENVINTFDPEKYHYIKPPKKGNEKNPSTPVTEESFKLWGKTAKDTYLSIAKAIHHNEFPIYEVSRDHKTPTENPCQYCPYSDICFRHRETSVEEEDE